MGLWSTVKSGFSRLTGRGGGGAYPLVSPSQLTSLFGRPTGPMPLSDKIVSDIWVQPYRTPFDLDRYGKLTPELQRSFIERYLDTPVLRAAVRGKADALSCLDPVVQPGADPKKDPRAALAAEFLDWSVQRSPRGWRGLIDSIYTPASLLGFSLCEKKLEPGEWEGRFCWTLAHVRQLDTTMLRLQLDQYRNVLAIVNSVRGLEYYSPDDVILHTHNGLFGNPFGQSDVRAASRACNIIQDVYLVWYIALKVYGLPYMVGKYNNATQQKAITAALQSIREGGFAVTSVEDEIEVLNMAAAAATDGFERAVQTQREDIFFTVRGTPQPFMEGDGGANAHTDTTVQKASSDANEYASALDVADTINRQLVPWLIGPNFGFDCPMPRVKFGGTNQDDTDKWLKIITQAQQAGADVSAEWFYGVTGVERPRDASDRLVSAQEKQQQQQQQAQQQAQQAQAAQAAQPADPNAAASAPGGEDGSPRQLRRVQIRDKNGVSRWVRKYADDADEPAAFSAHVEPAVDLDAIVDELLEGLLA